MICRLKEKLALSCWSISVITTLITIDISSLIIIDICKYCEEFKFHLKPPHIYSHPLEAAHFVCSWKEASLASVAFDDISWW